MWLSVKTGSLDQYFTFIVKIEGLKFSQWLSDEFINIGAMLRLSLGWGYKIKVVLFVLGLKAYRGYVNRFCFKDGMSPKSRSKIWGTKIFPANWMESWWWTIHRNSFCARIHSEAYLKPWKTNQMSILLENTHVVWFTQTAEASSLSVW